MTPAQLARHSHRVYRDDQVSHSAGSGQALLEIGDDDRATLSFRGTEKNMEDILTDLRFLPWRSHKLRAWGHAGFLKSARALYEVLYSDVVSLLNDGKSLDVGGHSLGGAQATWFVAFLVCDFPHITKRADITLNCFGSPAPQYGHGLEKWLTGIPTSLWKNGSDCVPSHPWAGNHVRHRLYIGPEDTTARSLTDARYFDHKIARYAENLP